MLRANQQALLTVFEVLMHDPLSSWVLSPTAAVRRQQDEATQGSITVDDNDDSDVNKDAQHTLLMLKRKLQGIDGGQSLSVEGQVNKLIVEAQSFENLWRMFHGWGAWV